MNRETNEQKKTKKNETDEKHFQHQKIRRYEEFFLQTWSCGDSRTPCAAVGGTRRSSYRLTTRWVFTSHHFYFWTFASKFAQYFCNKKHQGDSLRGQGLYSWSPVVRKSRLSHNKMGPESTASSHYEAIKEARDLHRQKTQWLSQLLGMMKQLSYIRRFARQQIRDECCIENFPFEKFHFALTLRNDGDVVLPFSDDAINAMRIINILYIYNLVFIYDL